MSQEATRQLTVKNDLIRIFKFPHFVHAGLLDTVTTYLALTLGFFELNFIVNHLYPEWAVLLPALLVGLAYGRGFAALTLFKRSSRVKEVMLFALYFPPAFNTVNIVIYLVMNSGIF